MASPRPPQISLWWILTRMTAVAVVCAATTWWVNRVQRMEAVYGVVTLRSMHATIFLAIILLGVVLAVALVPPLCIAVAMLWPRRRPKKKD